jgi:hypothetical protein
LRTTCTELEKHIVGLFEVFWGRRTDEIALTKNYENKAELPFSFEKNIYH